MIVTGGKIYETCGRCGKLVRLNKPIFGSLHVCGRGRESRFDEQCRVDRRNARKIMRQALSALGLPRGVDDDEHMCFEECGIRLGQWCLCWGEAGVGDLDEVFLVHDVEGEYMVNKELRVDKIVKSLKKILDENGLWKQLR